MYERGCQEPGEEFEGTAGPHDAGRLRWRGGCRRAIAPCVLLGACMAVMGWAACRGAALPRIRWRGSRLLGLASPEELASLPYVDDASGQRIALSSQLQARCVGEVFSAAFQLADVSVTAIAANSHCSYTRKANGMQGLETAEDALGNVEAVLGTLSDAAATQGTPVGGLVAQVREHMDQLQAALERAGAMSESSGAARRLQEDLYSPRRTAQTLCTRDIGWMLTSSLGAGAQLTQSLPNCNPGFSKEFRRKSKCAQQVLLSMRVTALLTATIAMMVDGCRPGASHYGKCAADLELMSWIIAGAARVYSNAVLICGNYGPKPGSKLRYIEVPRCTGPILSSMGYVSAASLNIASGRNHWCSSAKSLLASTADPSSLTPAQEWQLTEYRARCARDVLSGVRQLLYASYRMISAAAGCTNTNYLCNQDISRAASGFVGVGQAIAQVVDRCYILPQEIAQTQTEEERKAKMARCAARSLALVKILSVTVSYASEATSSCIPPNLAKSRCVASVWRAIAGLGALAQEFSEMPVHCKLAFTQNWYACGINQNWAGGSFRIFVLGFTGALLNCPLSPFREEWDATGHFNFPFWFSFP